MGEGARRSTIAGKPWVTVAAAAYPLDRLADWGAYETKIARWVEEAAGAGADLLVFPEYGAMELAALGDDPADMQAAARTVSGLMPRANALHAELAARHGVHILRASAPTFAGGPRPVNRARLFLPDGRSAAQDKQIMTRFEREEWNIVPGGPLRLFDTGIGRIGVLICYDAEFPLLARALVEAGAEILLVPSYTEALSGWMRVRVGARARALEGQCVVVHAPVVGESAWCGATDGARGAAGIYAPPDGDFPDDGLLARGEIDRPGWVLAEIDRGAIARVRERGRVLNMAHWPEQKERLERLEIAPFSDSELENSDV